MVRSLAFGWIAVVGAGVGCASGESRPLAPVASAPTVAIEPPAVPPSSEPARAVTPELTAWQQLLEREAVFRARPEGDPCPAGWRLTLVAGDLDSNLGLAEFAGCSQRRRSPASVEELCCPESLEMPLATRTGGGGSCESVLHEFLTEQQRWSGSPHPHAAAHTAGQYGSLLSDRAYVAHCELPAGMTVRVCAAIREGVATGVTVETRPPTQGIGDCVAKAVFGLRFPSSSTLDVTSVVF